MEFVNDGVAVIKPVIGFEGRGQSLVVNRTNLGALSAMFGDDMGDWVGQTVRLTAARVAFKGSSVDTIRVGHPKNERVPS